jgi:hypothetical protein
MRPSLGATISHLGNAHSHMVFGRLSEAAAPIRRARSLGASYGLRLQMMIGWILAEAGERDEAVAHLERTAAPASSDPHRAPALVLAHALRGDEERALEHLNSDAVRHLQSEYDALVLASGCALLGRAAEGVAWLRTSVERGHINHPYMNTHSSLLAGLRASDPFVALMQEVRPRWESMVDWERAAGA